MKKNILNGANMDIDLFPNNKVSWKISPCPWNEKDNKNIHKCAEKNVSVCDYFCGIEYPDKVICGYPNNKK